MERPELRLHVAGRDVAPLEDARAVGARTRGLLGRDGLDGAILLTPAKQVHSFGMRFDLDVAFVDRRGRVLRTVRLPRNRLTRISLRARSVVEAAAGAFERWGLEPGVEIAAVAAEEVS